MTNLAAEKRDMLIRFLNQFEKSDKYQLTFAQVMEMYKSFVKERNLQMSNEGVRLILRKNWPFENISKVSKAKIVYLVQPRLFKYLDEETMRGKRARDLYSDIYIIKPI